MYRSDGRETSLLEKTDSYIKIVFEVSLAIGLNGKQFNKTSKVLDQHNFAEHERKLVHRYLSLGGTQNNQNTLTLWMHTLFQNGSQFIILAYNFE